MVLFSFSIPEMISLIKTGAKHQTTRKPRKPHKNGTPAYKVGDKVQLYYKSRQKPSCQNCIESCPYTDKKTYPHPYAQCAAWTNFFGESEIIEIFHYDHEYYDGVGFEFGMEQYLGNMPEEDKESWAKADGFESWKQANAYFSNSTKNHLWAFEPLDVIVWDKEPIIKRWKK